MKNRWKRALASLCVVSLVAAYGSPLGTKAVSAAEETENNNYIIFQSEDGENIVSDGNIKKQILDAGVKLPSSVTKENLDLYIKVDLKDAEAVSVMKHAYVELSHITTGHDSTELQWGLKNLGIELEEGINEIRLNLGKAKDTGIDLTETIQWFRIYEEETASSGEILLYEVKLIDITEAGMEFGETDTYLQLEETLAEAPKTIEASVKMAEDVSEWVIRAADETSFSYGLGTSATLKSVQASDSGDAPEVGVAYTEVVVNSQRGFGFTKTYDVNIPSKYELSDIELDFYLYSSVAGTLPGTLELTSSGTCDKQEISWNFANTSWELQVGWNHIVLPLNTRTNTNDTDGAFELQNVNYVRWYSDSLAEGTVFGITDMRLKVVETQETTEWTVFSAANPEVTYIIDAATSNITTTYGTTTDGEEPGTGVAYTQYDMPANTDTSQKGQLAFWKKLNISVPSKYTKNDLVLSFWVHSSTAGKMPNGEFELGSMETGYGEKRLYWGIEAKVGNLSAGWNYVELELREGTEETDFALTDITYMRWRTYDSAVSDAKTYKFTDMTLQVKESDVTSTSSVTRTENVDAETLTSNYMIFSNTNVEVETAPYALFVTSEGYPALLWGSNQYTLDYSVCTGDWVDIAVSRDADGYINFYIDGELKGKSQEKEESTLGAFATAHCIGADGAGGQIFDGKIADVRVWSDERSAEEISENRISKQGTYVNNLTGKEEGLIGAWYLFGDIQDVLETLPDISSNKNAAVYRGSRAEDWLDYDKTQYEFLYDDNNNENYWSVVFIPDIQNLTEGTHTDTWLAMADWIADNIETENIQHVIGAGDTTWSDKQMQYEIAMQGFSKFIDKVSWSNMIGNHDYVWDAEYRDSTNYQNYFGEEVIQSSAAGETYQGYFEDPQGRSTTENSYYRFDVNGVKWMVLQLEYHPRQSVIDWAGEILKQYPLDNVILTTHGYINNATNYLTESMTYINNTTDGDGIDYIETTEAVLTTLKQYSNIKFILCGHCTDGTGAITVKEETNDAGETVPALMINAQDMDWGDGTGPGYYTNKALGMLGILRFSEDGSQVAIQYYAPQYEKSFSPEDRNGDRNSNNITMTLDVETCTYVKKYDSATGGTAPTDAEDYRTQGYLFAGWYRNEACTQAVTNEETVTTAYAKYVDAEVLSVKAQVSGNLYNDTMEDDGPASLRFVTTVDSLGYQEIGFYLTKGTKTVKKGSDSVYKILYAIGVNSTEDAEPLQYNPDLFSPASQYFKTFTLTGFSESLFNTEITAVPYWITLDGTEVEGVEGMRTINITRRVMEKWTEPTVPTATATDTSDGTIQSQLVSTIYETEDVVIADIVPTTMGYAVDPTGEMDSTAGIQKALDDCKAAGGGTVYLPAGTYSISGSLTIHRHVTLRGDWQDPDEGNEYGTVISVWSSSDDLKTETNENLAGTFVVKGAAGVVGLTVYYPEQSLYEVKEYPYTFLIHYDSMVTTLKNITVINGYQGIRTLSEQAHESLIVSNFKGTFLKTGMELYNSADVGILEHVVLSNEYWKGANASYMSRPSEQVLNTYVKTKTTGMILGDLEWSNFSDIAIDGLATGMQLVSGSRYEFSASMLDIDIKNCKQGLQIDDLDKRWGMVIARSSIANGIKSTMVWGEDTGNQLGADGTNLTAMIKGMDVDVVGDIIDTDACETTINNNVDLDTLTIDYDASYVKPNEYMVVADLTKRTEDNLQVDVSEALQTLLTQVGKAGGGVVYVPAGVYCLLNPITVPAGVELRGSSSVATRELLYSDTTGTVFFAYYGDGESYNADEDAALITLAGENAGLNGVHILYPDNGPKNNTELNTTYAVRGTASGVYVVNSHIGAAAYGIDFSGCNNHYLKGVYGCCYYNFCRLGGSNGKMIGCLSNPNMVRRTMLPVTNWYNEDGDGSLISAEVTDKITRVNTQMVIVENTENQLIYNVFSYGSKNLIVNTNSTNTLTVNIGSDNLGSNEAQLVNENGDMIVLNSLRYNGTSYSNQNGRLTLYNRIAMDETENQIETSDTTTE